MHRAAAVVAAGGVAAGSGVRAQWAEDGVREARYAAAAHARAASRCAFERARACVAPVRRQPRAHATRRHASDASTTHYLVARP